MVKIIRLSAVRGDHSGDLTSISPKESLASGSTFPSEYAVPSVETTTSFATKPPTSAILVRQSNPASHEMLSNAVPILPAMEYLSPVSACSASIAVSRSFKACAASESLLSSPAVSTSLTISADADDIRASRCLSNFSVSESGSPGNVIIAHNTTETAKMTVPAFLIYCHVLS